MRRLFPAVVLLGLLVEVGGTAVAQITLVPGQPFLVSRRPEFIAAADFNGDQLEDAVTTNPGSDKITVLYGSGTGTFTTVLDLDIGQRLENIATGDLNQDGIPDVAVVTNFGNSVFVADARGDGTFNVPPRGPFVVGKRPVGIAVGNFDNQNGNDIVTADQNIDRVTVLRNQGGNRGFVSAGDFPVGDRPQAVVAGDLTNDGWDDVVAMNTGTANADDVSVLINNRVSQGVSLTTPRNFVVGAKSKSIALADVNNDGALDILVLNGGVTARVNTFTVSVLVNQTTTANDRVVGTGFFSTLSPVQVTCPSTIGGIPIFCNPNVIAPGDFDADGRVDFVLSFQTLPQLGGSTPTAGLITAYQGNGDGSFDFATQVPVGLRPKGIVSADFNGDTIPDVATSEEGDRTVRMVLALKPPLRCPGDPCTQSRQCVFPGSTPRQDSCPGDESRPGFCVDGVCCNEEMCPASQVCDLPGQEGTCHPPLDNGAQCLEDTHCSSSFCVDGFCCGARACPPGQFCNSGECGPPAQNGTPCNDGPQCASGFCVDGTCCADSRCPVGQRCDIDESEGFCRGPAPIGADCDVAAQCESGFCVDGKCCVQASCPSGQQCNVLPNPGFCMVAPPPTETPTITPTVTQTLTPSASPTPQPNGAPCNTGGQCSSGSCVNSTCCSTGTCPSGQRCDVFGSGGVCAAPRGQGQECRLDIDCASGNCESGSPPRCAAPRTATPTATPLPLDNGEPCADNSDCQSDHCVDDFCCESASCPNDESCGLPGHEGECFPPPRQGGDQCIPGVDECEDDMVCNEDGVCCDTDTCPPGERCDIFGSMGFCSEPLPQGEECRDHPDCAAGLECRFDPFSQQTICQPPRTPTPTLIIPPAPTFTAGLQVSSTRGGGCAIGGEDSNGAGAAWTLLLLPLVLGLRRAQVVRVDNRRQ